MLFASPELKLTAAHIGEIVLDGELIEHFARVEHRRWMADRIDRGWTSGSERDNARLIHPSIKPFDQLTAAEQEKTEVRSGRLRKL